MENSIKYLISQSNFLRTVIIPLDISISKLQRKKGYVGVFITIQAPMSLINPEKRDVNVYEKKACWAALLFHAMRFAKGQSFFLAAKSLKVT